MGDTILSTPINLKSKTAPNRFAILPTEGNDALPDGSPSDRTVERYRKLAEGKAGIVFSEAVTVDPDGRARKYQLVLENSTAGGFEDMIGAFRRTNPEALFILQLDHAGSLSDPSFSRPVSVYPKHGAALLSADDLQSIRDRFVEAALLAREAGADGIDLKFAHGFLLGEILHPRNNRAFLYGGSFDNRLRFFEEIIRGIAAGCRTEGGRGTGGKDGGQPAGSRKASSDDFLVGLRISAYEGIPGGFGTSGSEEVIEDYSEPERLSARAAELGAAFVSVSAGNAASNLQILLPGASYPDAVFRHFGWQRRIKRASGLPVVGAGYTLLRDGNNAVPGDGPETRSLRYWAEKNIAGGTVDIVGLGRQGIADPSFPAKFLSGADDDIDYCKTCGGCGALLGAQQNIGCVQYDDYYRELHARNGG